VFTKVRRDFSVTHELATESTGFRDAAEWLSASSLHATRHSRPA
jgi:hypothetical protein